MGCISPRNKNRIIGQSQKANQILCSGLIGGSQNMSILQFPEPMNVNLFGKGVFADIIKLRILRWGDHPGLSG